MRNRINDYITVISFRFCKLFQTQTLIRKETLSNIQLIVIFVISESEK